MRQHVWNVDTKISVSVGTWFKCGRCEMTVFAGPAQTPDEVITKNLNPARFYEDCDAQVVANIELA